MKTINIAIDGPSGAGKSSLSRYLAAQLGFVYVDTGALYRAVGLAAARRGIGMGDALAAVAMLGEITVGFEPSPQGQKTLLDGADVSDSIRSEEISMYASAVSGIPPVRAFLLETQRRIAREQNVVMDGRDIATVVLPDADIKIYLTASPEDRARRRYDQENGAVPLEELTKLMIRRDEQDMTRPVSPLRRHPDAIYLDTTGNTLEQSRALLLDTVRARLGK